MTKKLTKKQREINFKASQKRYKDKIKVEKILIPLFHITKQENEDFALKAFAKYGTKKEALVEGLKLVAAKSD